MESQGISKAAPIKTITIYTVWGKCDLILDHMIYNYCYNYNVLYARHYICIQ